MFKTFEKSVEDYLNNLKTVRRFSDLTNAAIIEKHPAETIAKIKPLANGEYQIVVPK